MKISFSICLSCLLTAQAFAHSPNLAVSDNSSVTVTRHSFSNGGITLTAVCVRPNSGSTYAPSDVSVHLQQMLSEYLSVFVAPYKALDGSFCAEIDTSSDTLDKYIVRITGTNGKPPYHIFFQGPLSAIPSK
jgi:hypothetical protein